MPTNIQVLKELGADAFGNLFDVSIPQVPGVTGVNGISFRIQTFPIPVTPTPTIYTVHYKTAQLQKIGSKFPEPDPLALQVRIDKEQFVYEFFKEWKQLGINQYTGVLDEDLIPKVPMTVQSTDSGSSLTGATWVFEDCYPLSIEGFDYDQTAEDPLLRTINIYYSIMDDTQRSV